MTMMLLCLYQLNDFPEDHLRNDLNSSGRTLIYIGVYPRFFNGGVHVVLAGPEGLGDGSPHSGV